MSKATIKCSKGHVAQGVNYRKQNQSVIRIFNYWYCEKCNKIFKSKPTGNNGVFAN